MDPQNISTQIEKRFGHFGYVARHLLWTAHTVGDPMAHLLLRNDICLGFVKVRGGWRGVDRAVIDTSHLTALTLQSGGRKLMVFLPFFAPIR
jgi:hypothetical protein